MFTWLIYFRFEHADTFVHAEKRKGDGKAVFSIILLDTKYADLSQFNGSIVYASYAHTSISEADAYKRKYNNSLKKKVKHAKELFKRDATSFPVLIGDHANVAESLLIFLRKLINNNLVILFFKFLESIVPRVHTINKDCENRALWNSSPEIIVQTFHELIAVLRKCFDSKKQWFNWLLMHGSWYNKIP